MANFRPYVNKSGTTTQLADADTTIVGNGITTSAGALTIGSAANSLILAAGLALSVAGGAGAIDFSGSSGLFKTPTGAVTIGPGAVTVSGATTFGAAGTALTVTNNALISGNLTVTGTLTATVGNAINLVSTGLTTTGVTSGICGYVSANNVMTKTDCLVAASSRFFGVNTGTVGAMTTSGTATVAMTTIGGSPAAGAPVWLAASTDEASAVGKCTATAPSATGSCISEVGLCLDNSNYVGAKTVVILLEPKGIIQL